ncbi:ammonium transporter [Acetobacter orientalis]|uniref:Ammonium transporter n=1 Tax=Acetobacter orientalis TaxID=146474 RepID=A0A2Z5ZEV9_9PROT|nr:ammonium transporter [Acetobacter orientalis]
MTSRSCLVPSGLGGFNAKTGAAALGGAALLFSPALAHAADTAPP